MLPGDGSVDWSAGILVENGTVYLVGNQREPVFGNKAVLARISEDDFRALDL